MKSSLNASSMRRKIRKQYKVGKVYENFPDLIGQFRWRNTKQNINLNEIKSRADNFGSDEAILWIQKTYKSVYCALNFHYGAAISDKRVSILILDIKVEEAGLDDRYFFICVSWLWLDDIFHTIFYKNKEALREFY